MAIRKSPYKVDADGIDKAFVLPKDLIKKDPAPPAIKIRKARRGGEETPPDQPMENLGFAGQKEHEAYMQELAARPDPSEEDLARQLRNDFIRNKILVRQSEAKVRKEQQQQKQPAAEKPASGQSALRPAQPAAAKPAEESRWLGDNLASRARGAEAGRSAARGQAAPAGESAAQPQQPVGRGHAHELRKALWAARGKKGPMPEPEIRPQAQAAGTPAQAPAARQQLVPDWFAPERTARDLLSEGQYSARVSFEKHPLEKQLEQQLEEAFTKEQEAAREAAAERKALEQELLEQEARDRAALEQERLAEQERLEREAREAEQARLARLAEEDADEPEDDTDDDLLEDDRAAALDDRPRERMPLAEPGYKTGLYFEKPLPGLFASEGIPRPAAILGENAADQEDQEDEIPAASVRQTQASAGDADDFDDDLSHPWRPTTKRARAAREQADTEPEPASGPAADTKPARKTARKTTKGRAVAGSLLDTMADVSAAPAAAESFAGQESADTAVAKEPAAPESPGTAKTVKVRKAAARAGQKTGKAAGARASAKASGKPSGTKAEEPAAPAAVAVDEPDREALAAQPEAAPVQPTDVPGAEPATTAATAAPDSLDLTDGQTDVEPGSDTPAGAVALAEPGSEACATQPEATSVQPTDVPGAEPAATAATDSPDLADIASDSAPGVDATSVQVGDTPAAASSAAEVVETAAEEDALLEPALSAGYPLAEDFDEDDEGADEEEAVAAQESAAAAAPGSEEGRVRFLTFYTWSSLPGHLVSLRTSRGEFAAPGCFTALQATRSALPILSALREFALKHKWPLSVQMIFVPVVYPSAMPFRFWQRNIDPFEHNIVCLHHLQKSVLHTFLDRLLPEQQGMQPKLTDLASHVLRNPGAFTRFFADEANRYCHGIIVRGAASLFFGQDCPFADRLVNYAVLRPEWIVDVRPVASADDLLGNVRSDPEKCLEKLSSMLVVDREDLQAALQQCGQPDYGYDKDLPDGPGTGADTAAASAEAPAAQPAAPAGGEKPASGKDSGKKARKTASKTAGKTSSKASGKTSGKTAGKTSAKATGKTAGKA